MPRWNDQEEPVVVEEAVDKTTPPIRLEPFVPHDEGFDVDNGYYPAN